MSLPDFRVGTSIFLPDLLLKIRAKFIILVIQTVHYNTKYEQSSSSSSYGQFTTTQNTSKVHHSRHMDSSLQHKIRAKFIILIIWTVHYNTKYEQSSSSSSYGQFTTTQNTSKVHHPRHMDSSLQHKI